MTTKSLVTVKCITRKLATQVRFVEYDWNEGSMHKQIWSALIQDQATVIGWCPAVQVEKACKSLGPIWLVKIKADLYWWIPPTKGPIIERHAGPELEQLFID